MATTEQKIPGIVFADVDALLEIMDEYDRQTGFVPDPTATPEKVQAMMLADSVDPEDNAATREIIQLREGEEG